MLKLVALIPAAAPGRRLYNCSDICKGSPMAGCQLSRKLHGLSSANALSLLLSGLATSALPEVGVAE